MQHFLKKEQKRLLITVAAILAGTFPARAQNVIPDRIRFVRIEYDMGELGNAFHGRYGRQDSWQVDSPAAEDNFMEGFAHATKLQITENAASFALTDAELFEYAFAYVVEVGYLRLREDEAAKLREWLLRGGFLFIDDFHGPLEWANFRREITKVFPERPIQDIPADHPIFHCYYDFDYFPQVPGLASLWWGRTYEKGGRVPHCRGIFDDEGRLMVLVNHNVDLGDSWEHAKDPRYDMHYSRLGYMLGINYVIYALTH